MRRSITSRALRQISSTPPASSSSSSPRVNTATTPCILCQNNVSRNKIRSSNPAFQISSTSSLHTSSSSPAPLSRPHAQAQHHQPPPPPDTEILSLQQQQPKNHYELFPQTLPGGLPPSSPFHIDLRTLRREFLQLQSQIHPDKYPTGPLKRHAESQSALINEAYKTLSSPLLRAQYILGLHGIDVTSEAQGTQTHDPEILMAVLEVQERLEEADLAEEEVDEMKAENRRRIDKSVRVVGGLIEAGDWHNAGKEAVRLKYWMSLHEGLDSWETGSGAAVLMH